MQPQLNNKPLKVFDGTQLMRNENKKVNDFK